MRLALTLEFVPGQSYWAAMLATRGAECSRLLVFGVACRWKVSGQEVGQEILDLRWKDGYVSAHADGGEHGQSN